MDPGRRPVIVGTAGHVDHGKTTLVKALTGVDTDRLPEEKAREITIELGFAPLHLPDGTTCGVVDVPGHERFIKNMLAGATGVDVVLLCVDAREWVGPQTKEHLDILDLVGARAGVAALTKIDTIPPAEVAPAVARLAAYLSETVLAGCPVIPVSAKTGQGLERLRTALAQGVEAAYRDRTRTSGAAGPARLAVDRAFSVAGFGPVVTGTVAAGRITVGQRLQVYPEGPVLRVRGIEAHGRTATEVQAGERAALNLAGDLGSLAVPALRGRVLAGPGTLEPASVVGLELRLLAGADPVKDLQRLRLHAGTAETLGRIVLLDGAKEVVPGSADRLIAAAFEAETPLALARGQAFVVRSYSPPRTIGGGRVLVPSLDLDAGGHPRSKTTRQAMGAVLAAASGRTRPAVPGGLAPLAQYLRLLGAEPGQAGAGPPPPGRLPGQPPHGEQPPGVRLMAGGQYVAEEDLYLSVTSELLARLAEQHRAKPHLATLGREAVWSYLEGRGLAPSIWLETLATEGAVVLDRGRIRLAGWEPELRPELKSARASLLAAFDAGLFSPPSFAEAANGLPSNLAAEALEGLLLEGALICPSGLPGAMTGEPAFSRAAVAEARRRLEEHLDRSGETTVAGFRDLVGSTRKYALPLLEWFDREKVTLRRGDLRVRHPATRSPEPGARRSPDSGATRSPSADARDPSSARVSEVKPS